MVSADFFALGLVLVQRQEIWAHGGTLRILCKDFCAAVDSRISHVRFKYINELQVQRVLSLWPEIRSVAIDVGDMTDAQTEHALQGLRLLTNNITSVHFTTNCEMQRHTVSKHVEQILLTTCMTLTGLSELKLQGLPWTCMEALMGSISPLTSLQKLCLQSVALESSKSLVWCPPALASSITDLEVHCQKPPASGDAELSLIPHLTRLTSLRLNPVAGCIGGHASLYQNLWQDVRLPSLTHLTELDAGNLHLHGEDLACMSSLQTLAVRSIEDHPGCFAGLTALRHWVLKHIGPGELAGLRQLTGLTDVDVRHSEQMTPDGFRDLCHKTGLLSLALYIRGRSGGTYSKGRHLGTEELAESRHLPLGELMHATSLVELRMPDIPLPPVFPELCHGMRNLRLLHAHSIDGRLVGEASLATFLLSMPPRVRCTMQMYQQLVVSPKSLLQVLARNRSFPGFKVLVLRLNRDEAAKEGQAGDAELEAGSQFTRGYQYRLHSMDREQGVICTDASAYHGRDVRLLQALAHLPRCAHLALQGFSLGQEELDALPVPSKIEVLELRFCLLPASAPQQLRGMGLKSLDLQYCTAQFERQELTGVAPTISVSICNFFPKQGKPARPVPS